MAERGTRSKWHDRDPLDEAQSRCLDLDPGQRKWRLQRAVFLPVGVCQSTMSIFIANTPFKKKFCRINIIYTTILSEVIHSCMSKEHVKKMILIIITTSAEHRVAAIVAVFIHKPCGRARLARSISPVFEKPDGEFAGYGQHLHSRADVEQTNCGDEFSALSVA